jgi:hypothetical protein
LKWIQHRFRSIRPAEGQPRLDIELLFTISVREREGDRIGVALPSCTGEISGFGDHQVGGGLRAKHPELDGLVGGLGGAVCEGDLPQLDDAVVGEDREGMLGHCIQTATLALAEGKIYGLAVFWFSIVNNGHREIGVGLSRCEGHGVCWTDVVIHA